MTSVPDAVPPLKTIAEPPLTVIPTALPDTEHSSNSTLVSTVAPEVTASPSNTNSRPTAPIKVPITVCHFSINLLDGAVVQHCANLQRRR